MQDIFFLELLEHFCSNFWAIFRRKSSSSYRRNVDTKNKQNLKQILQGFLHAFLSEEIPRRASTCKNSISRFCMSSRMNLCGTFQGMLKPFSFPRSQIPLRNFLNNIQNNHGRNFRWISRRSSLGYFLWNSCWIFSINCRRNSSNKYLKHLRENADKIL